MADTPFREWFGCVGELRSMLTSATLLLLAATASKGMRTKLKYKLGAVVDTELVASADRLNIKMFVARVNSTNPVTVTFRWLLWSTS